MRHPLIFCLQRFRAPATQAYRSPPRVNIRHFTAETLTLLKLALSYLGHDSDMLTVNKPTATKSRHRSAYINRIFGDFSFLPNHS